MSPQQQRPLSHSAAALIADPGIFIEGRWESGAGKDTITSVDPFTERSIAEAQAAGPDQVEAAIHGARRAFDDGRWSGLAPRERGRLLHRVVGALTDRRDDLVEILVAETGSPVTLTRTVQVDSMLEHLAWFADAAARGPRDGFEQGLPPHPGPPVSGGTLIREPIGVVAAMTPYNIPLVTAAWKVGAALAAGCAAILLPSPRAALTSLAWARIVAEADLPPGVFSFLTGGHDVGRRLTESELVDMVTFTGSNTVGEQVLRQTSGTFKRVVLELGGKSPNVLLPGTDVEAVAGPSSLRFLRNAGQACGATTRTFVPRGDYERYTAATREFFDTVAVGDPWDDRTVVGPLIRAEHRARVEGYVERALIGGATVEAGGGRPPLERGFFMNPTLVGGVGNDAEIAREELFGPVGVIIAYDDVDDAVKMANASRFGLNANVWGPLPEALRVARRIRSGTVTVNGGGGLRTDTPFGGYRHSGIGREAGDEGFLEFFEVKHLQWPLSGSDRARIG